MAAPALILASGSKARRDMLAAAGLEFEIIPASIDEKKIVAGLKQKLAPAEIAAALARQKALGVAASQPEAYVIGGDQILVCEDRLYAKAESAEEARQKLQSLAGKTHYLISAVCVARGAEVLWSQTDSAALTMRPLTEAEINDYVGSGGEAITRAVGAYELEGLGMWLFDKVEGDFYTILGMPLLPLLHFLRLQGYRPASPAS